MASAVLFAGNKCMMLQHLDGAVVKPLMEHVVAVIEKVVLDMAGVADIIVLW